MYAHIIPEKTTTYDVILHGEVLASCNTKAEAEAEQAKHPHSVLRYFAEADELQRLGCSYAHKGRKGTC